MLISLLLACSTPEATKPTPDAAKTEVAKTEAPAAKAEPQAEAGHEGHEGHEGHGAEGGAWEAKLGEAVDASAAKPIDEIVGAADTWNGKAVTVKGTVREVCQKKGCWHTIATADPNVNVMVKDKDYGIFLPKDAAGRTAVIKGTFLVQAMDEAEARHYAEDAGRDPNSIHGAQKSFQMDADGVQLL